MYELVRNVGFRVTLARESACLLLALLIAEFFYKFHSFTLEAVAFLATWYGLGWATALLLNHRD